MISRYSSAELEIKAFPTPVRKRNWLALLEPPPAVPEKKLTILVPTSNLKFAPPSKPALLSLVWIEPDTPPGSLPSAAAKTALSAEIRLRLLMLALKTVS